nr:hypothetical protein GCM10025732_49970 [Glycomyces mayteni]
MADAVEAEAAGLNGDAQRGVERPCAERFGELWRHRHTLSLDTVCAVASQPGPGRRILYTGKVGGFVRFYRGPTIGSAGDIP